MRIRYGVGSASVTAGDGPSIGSCGHALAGMGTRLAIAEHEDGRPLVDYVVYCDKCARMARQSRMILPDEYAVNRWLAMSATR